ncbi:hypothetical protein [Catenuloplanes atrovinosus]|uniref:Uncharacterized protein n=1 Tax=Catenuloplanes atrovinosus TaxID=137266 RepID=A0AAE3YNX9_9ACTN|nr:hypothetical protein [Catenuloplanes atrovinosus]MDR7276487.1 hypothetical protein [Catenuloplanes atrovinosus]
MVKRVIGLMVIVPLVVLALLWVHHNGERVGDDFADTICELRAC